jgi:hypothetical protein
MVDPRHPASVAFGCALACACAGACFVAATARASDPSPAADAPATLEWHGPAECHEGPRVLAGMRRLLAGERAGSDLVARVEAARNGKRWHLTITTEQSGRTTSRVLDADSCGAAADAIAVILTLTIDPSRPLDTDDGAASSAAHRSARDAFPPDAGNPRDASSSDRGAPGVVADEKAGLLRREPPPIVLLQREGDEDDAAPVTERADAGEAASVPLFLFAIGAADVGTLPQAAFGFGGGLGVAAGPFHFEGAVGYWPTVSTTTATGESGAFTMVAADLRGCALVETGPLSFGPCAGGGITWMRAEGLGVTTPLVAAATWGDFVADALLRARISSTFWPRLSAGASVPFSRPTFGVEQSGGLIAVHQPAAAALQIRIGMEVHF